MKRSSIFTLAIAGVLALRLAACGGGNDNLPPPPPPPPAPPSVDAAAPIATTAPSDTSPPKPPPPPPTLAVGAQSPDPAAPLPTVKIVAPARDQVVPAASAADFAVKLDVKNWPTAVGSSHVHLILDNRPYKAIYDPSKPVRLSELAAAGPAGGALDEGRHVLVAFPSRANHESVKTKDALFMVSFWIGKKGDPNANGGDPTKKPMLIYSRPKGDYNGEMANHVLVDFQLANDTLAEGKDHVNITVSGPGISDSLTAKATKFGPPFYLDSLQDGTYTLKLELVDGSDKPIPGPWNSTTRQIKVDHEAAMDTTMGHGPAPATSGSAAPAPKGSGTPAKGGKPSASGSPKMPVPGDTSSFGGTLPNH